MDAADGEVFEDTYARGKPIVFVFGRRPFTGGMCKGVEEALATMRAGGRRIITVPPEVSRARRESACVPAQAYWRASRMRI